MTGWKCVQCGHPEYEPYLTKARELQDKLIQCAKCKAPSSATFAARKTREGLVAQVLESALAVLRLAHDRTLEARDSELFADLRQTINATCREIVGVTTIARAEFDAAFVKALIAGHAVLPDGRTLSPEPIPHSEFGLTEFLNSDAARGALPSDSGSDPKGENGEAG